MRGNLFIVSAPSGAGKSSLVNAVLAVEPQIALSISFTSRGPRPGERHAQHNHFLGRDAFERLIAAGDVFFTDGAAQAKTADGIAEPDQKEFD